MHAYRIRYSGIPVVIDRRMTSATRLPPGQTPRQRILRWYAEHPGIAREKPAYDLDRWTLAVQGLVAAPLTLSWPEFAALPTVVSVSGFHCVEGWSVLACRWGGVSFRTLVDLVTPTDAAAFATLACADGYTTSLAVQELTRDGVLLASKLDGAPLDLELGGPMRLVIPEKYAYKSAMWVTAITFTAEKALGYWEQRGYSDTADPWQNDRYTR